MKILNLYAGIGGNRKLWGDEHKITAAENDPSIAKIYQDFFPNDTVIITDAHQYLLDHYKEFDFIWSSPPCQTHTTFVRVNAKRYGLYKYPDMNLWQEIIFLQEFHKGKWVVENVKPYYKPLIPAKEVARHLFWTNFNIGIFTKKTVKGFINDANYNDLQEWLGIKMPFKITMGNSHDHRQVLRNCVHPETGLYILNCAMNIITQENVNQGEFQFKKR